MSIAPVDQVARDGVHEVRSMINQHQAVCEQFAVEAKEWRKETSEKLDRMATQIFGAAVSIIVLLIGVIGFLITNRGLPAG